MRRIVRILGHMSSDVAITRVINPSALIEVHGHAFLTDPYFDDHWFFPMNEPIGLKAAQLPKLTAILGCHGVFDHWQMQSLKGYPHLETTPVFTATKAMAKKAKSAGFPQATVLEWGDSLKLSNILELLCVQGEHAPGRHTNNYILKTAEASVFVGTEANRMEPIKACAADHRIDVAILPIDGLQFLRKQLVMNASQALEATTLLGAHTLAPVHYSQRSFAGLVRCSSGIQELLTLSVADPNITIAHGATGTRVAIPWR
jgi:L-ascorbate metabolism protein UlaG (beta-lactamase superfamily)